MNAVSTETHVFCFKNETAEGYAFRRISVLNQSISEFKRPETALVQTLSQPVQRRIMPVSF
jgi:hypothetical protein